MKCSTYPKRSVSRRGQFNTRSTISFADTWGQPLRNVCHMKSFSQMTNASSLHTIDVDVVKWELYLISSALRPRQRKAASLRASGETFLDKATSKNGQVSSTKALKMESVSSPRRRAIAKSDPCLYHDISKPGTAREKKYLSRR